VLGALVLALGSACGGTGRATLTPASAHVADASTTTMAGANGSAASPSPSTSVTSKGAGTGSPASPGPQTASNAAPSQAGGSPTPKGGLPIQVSLAAACVRPGTPQTITITTQPNAGVAYNSVYADGNNSRDNKDNYYGGNKGGKTDATGKWSDSWTLSAKAAPGPVHVDVVGLASSGQSGYTTAGFAVAGPDGRCS